VDKQWLKKMFVEAGLEADQAQKASDQTTLRLLKRERPTRIERKRPSILDNLVRDPLVSLNRIIGRGASGLPFVDDATGKLSAAAFSDVLTESGIDPIVSMAFAKVIEEAFTPRDLYQPIWEALGHEGAVDLDTLRREDWTALRSQFPELMPAPVDDQATEQVRTVKPRAMPPKKKPGPRG
jgi:hypothetical protein